MGPLGLQEAPVGGVVVVVVRQRQHQQPPLVLTVQQQQQQQLMTAASGRFLHLRPQQGLEVWALLGRVQLGLLQLERLVQRQQDSQLPERSGLRRWWQPYGPPLRR